MSGFVFFKNTDISNSGSSGSIPDPSVYGGRQLAVITPNTAHLPSSSSDLVKNNYVIVDRNLDDSVFPFTIDSVTFLSKYDSAIYNGSKWELLSGIQNTLSVRVVDKTNESLSGNATTQQEINKENCKELQDLRTRAQLLVGYFSSTEPTGAEEGDLWFETSADHDTGDDLPTTFPIQVKEYKNGAWSATTQDYTASNNDLWSNLNNRHGFYWFGNSWNLTDAVQPNLDPNDLEWNVANQISYKAHSVNSNILGTDITDDSTLTQDATTNKLKVKTQGITNNEVLDNTLSFSKTNSNSVATQNENANNKFVRADAMYNTAITKNVSQIKAKTGGGKEIEIDLQNEANVSKTKVNIDLDETATQNSNNPITSNGVWKEELNNTTSTLEYDDTNANKDVINLELKNNNGDTKIDKTIDFNDKIVFEDKTQELFNKTLDFDATSATKNIAENIPLSSLAKQTASDDKKILQVVGNDHHIDLSFLDVIKEVNSIPQTKDDEDVLLHLANDDRLYYWNEDEGEYVAVGGGGGGTNPEAIIDVASLPTTNIKDNVFYRVPAEEIFIHNGDKYSSVVCFQCEAGYVSIDATGITDTYSGTDPIFYSWENLTDNIINSLMQPVSTSTGNKYPISITNFSKDVNHFCKYGDDLYDSANNFIHTYNYQLFTYKDGAWENISSYNSLDDKPSLEDKELEGNTTRQDVGLIGEADIMLASEFVAPKAKGIDIVLDAGTSYNPDIINDDPAYKYANNKTSSNNYINTRLETIERKADAKTLTKFVDALPANPDLNTQYFVSTSTPNVYNRYFVDSLGNVKPIGNTEMDVSDLTSKQEFNTAIGEIESDFNNYYNKTESDNRYLYKQNFLNTFYPKGSIYTTYENKNPSTFLGGTWVLIGGQDANLNYYPAFAIETDTAGTTISESLPAINGSFAPAVPNSHGNYRTGCFTAGSWGTQGSFPYQGGSTAAPIYSYIFKASNSSPIYKDNAHVNVNAIKIFFWRRTDDAPIAFNTGNITMNTKIDENATDNDIPTSKAVYDYIPKVYKQLYRFNSGVASGDITLYDNLTKFTFCEILVKKSGSTDSFSVKANVQRMVAGAEQPCLNLYASGGVWCKATYKNATTLTIGGSGTLSVVEVIGWY